jgi:hypothetical protein
MPVLQPPAVPLFVAGTTGPNMPAAMNSLVRDPLTFFMDKPRARLRRSTALAVVENFHQYVAFNIADEDTATGWSSLDPTKYTVQAPGWYLIEAKVSLSGTGAAAMVLIPAIAVNGVSHTGVGSAGWEGMGPAVPTGVAAQPKASQFVGEVYANLGDYIQLDLFYTLESAITAVDTTAGWECALRLVHMGL